VDPNKGHFSCKTDKDCGSGYQCIAQANRPVSLCFPLGQCTHEVCDGVDNDCDGVVDNGFDLQTDNANCGACGHACSAGTACDGGICREVNCADGIDNDQNGLTDCEDPSCPGLPCSSSSSTVNCGTAWLAVDAGPSDGGTSDGGTLDGGAVDGGSSDAGALDAGLVCAGTADAGPCPGFLPVLACVLRETNCADGIDNDGDGQTDCADADCAGQPCGAGKSCTAGVCQ
jgi:hypothetical protein